MTEKHYVVEKFEQGEVHVDKGVFGWYFEETGEHRPFDEEQMQALMDAGYATEQDAKITEKQYDIHTKKIFEDYRQSRLNMSDEDRAELMADLRASHGEGETIVDVITGERYYT